MWEDILKRFGATQTPKPSLGSKVKTETKVSTDAEPLPEDEDEKYKVFITEQYNSPRMRGEWVQHPKELFDTRQDAYNEIERLMRIQGNPRPWTVEGSLFGGTATVYDGVFMVLGAPSYKFIIIEDGEDLPDPISYNPKVDNTSPSRVLDRLDGKRYDESRY
jgi:hypothetical protein